MTEKIKKVAIAAAMKAGEELLKRFDKFDRGSVELKSTHEIVTQADKAAEKIILKEIKANFPDHRILSEEAGESGGSGEYFWIVDPLDGSTNFSFHNPLWAVSIAVARLTPDHFTPDRPHPASLSRGEGGEVVFGLVYAPFMGEIFMAEKGKGTKMIEDGKMRKAKVSKIKTDKAINAFCHSYKQADILKACRYNLEQKTKGFDCRQLGSASLELAFTAAGRIESIYIPGARTWDVAAGALLVREAGGKVTDEEGRDWTLKSKGIVASNGLVHRQVLRVIKGL